MRGIPLIAGVAVPEVPMIRVGGKPAADGAIEPRLLVHYYDDRRDGGLDGDHVEDQDRRPCRRLAARGVHDQHGGEVISRHEVGMVREVAEALTAVTEVPGVIVR